MFVLRGLEESDRAAYNRFFAEGARLHPDRLRIAPEDVHAAPFSTKPSSEGRTFAAFDGDENWLGVVTVERELGRAKRRHVAWIVRMYVVEAANGHGIGRSLLARALDEARVWPDVAKVNLTVAAHNEAAVHLYESAGFVRFAEEDDAFRDPVPRRELTMSLRLR